ncbi:MAG: polyphosphate polymerase domain-containing protein [bacterium]
MANRLEYKYLVSSELLNPIRTDILPYVEVDPFAQKRYAKEYIVRSVYCDTPRFDCYWEKIEGLKVRKKFRIRGYDHPEKNSVVFLEIKSKYENFITKSRAPLLWEHLQNVLAAHDLDKYIISFSGNGEEKIDARRFLYNYYRRTLRPTVLIIYEREAFFSKFNPSLRLSFDKNLRSTLFPSMDMLYREEQVKLAMRKYFILEVKFYTGLPAWVQSIIKRYQLSRMALSKYTICLDSHQTPGKFSRRDLPLLSQFQFVPETPKVEYCHV